MPKNKNILIIGGSGFIGKYLRSKLLKNNNVFILDVKASNLKKQFKLDIRNKIQNLKNLRRVDLKIMNILKRILKVQKIHVILQKKLIVKI